MLRDLHHPINTNGHGRRKLLPNQRQVRSITITSLNAVLLHHLKSIFCDATPLLLRTAACAALARGRGERYQQSDTAQRGTSLMAVNDGGVPPILAQKHYTQPSAFTPENLLREARRQKRIE